MKLTSFRLWLQNIWQDNKEEHAIYGEPTLSISDYFNKYKYWLKREFRHQQRIK